MDFVDDQAGLRRHFGEMSELVARKVLPKLDHHCRAFIALSPFLVLATTDGQGGADASPRGDALGFVAIVDDSTLVIPDRLGNKRIDSFSNVLSHPGVGLLFFVPGIDETLRVNGTARIVTDTALLAPLAAQGKVPATGMHITVAEAFFHCGKALIRSKLWDPARHVPRASFPSLGRIVAEQTSVVSAEAAEANIAAAYRDRLY